MSFEELLERMVPGSARLGMGDADAPPFPTELGLQPRRLLGRGGIGFVYLAHDPVLDREVAVKIARPDGGEVARRALLAEAQTVSRLAHAHAQGIVHGDLHPANIAAGSQGEPYVLDWGSETEGAGVLQGHAGYAAPERLRGEEAGALADVYSLGAVAWESFALRPLRRRRADESLGEYVARWRQAQAPRLAELVEVDPEVDELVARCLSLDPSQRPEAPGLARELRLVSALLGERERRRQEARQYFQRSEDQLTRYRELTHRLSEERRVVSIQRAKIPGHAEVRHKRPLWEAEDRVESLVQDLGQAWLGTLESAVCARVLDPSLAQADAVVAEMWFERLRQPESLAPDNPTLSRSQVQRHDARRRFTRLLAEPAPVSLEASAPGASVRIARYVQRDRVLVPEVVDEHPLPLQAHPLQPGSWLLEVSAPGLATARLPVSVGRLEHQRLQVRLYRPEEVGEGWVQVPAGAFRLGGDRKARQPLDPCAPFLGDRFVQRTSVTTAAYKAFLDDLSPEQARQHLPSEQGLFGQARSHWVLEGEGWSPPEGWDLAWPIFSVNMADMEAYAAWLSQQEGRPLRLPTEEEWEKAARGVDGRAYPWGDTFDPTFCHMRQSVPGSPHPAPAGSYPVDCSVYGCLDMAGNMRELTASPYDEGQHVLRGGTWGDDADDCRVACRSGMQPWFRNSFVSFRLITEVPRPG